MKHVIFFTGAGVSEESGIPTFRGSDDSLWSKYNVDIVASEQGIRTHLQDVLEFHNYGRQLMEKCKPNKCHLAIAELEKKYKVTVVTTNIDNLHEKAGSTNVIHLHGSVFQACDINKNKTYDLNEDIKVGDLHPETGLQLRHNTVLFGEQLDVDCITLYNRTVRKADALVVIGSSLSVFPSSAIVQYNDNVIYLNPVLPDNYSNSWTLIKETACEGIDQVVKLLQ